MIRELLNEKGITAYKMAKDLGLPTSTVSEWLSGKYKPKADKLLAIARYFGVPVETLIEETQEEP